MSICQQQTPNTQQPTENFPEITVEKEAVVEKAGETVKVTKEIAVGTSDTAKSGDGVTSLKEEIVEKLVQTVAEIFSKASEEASAQDLKMETPKVAINMANATVIPSEILEAAKGKDIDIVLEMAGGYSWTINGKDINGASLSDINLQVSVNTDVVPSGLISKLAGDSPTTQLSLTHNGNFGFKATLNVNVGSENVGQYANLYYYDSTGKLVFMNAGKISEDGTVSLDFSHASDYVVVVGENMGTAPRTGERSVLPLVLVFAVSGIMFFGIGALRLRKKY